MSKVPSPSINFTNIGYHAYVLIYVNFRERIILKNFLKRGRGEVDIPRIMCLTMHLYKQSLSAPQYLDNGSQSGREHRHELLMALIGDPNECTLFLGLSNEKIRPI